MRLRATRAVLFAVGILLSGVLSATAQTSRNGTFNVNGFVGDKLAGRSVSYGNEATYFANIHSDNNTAYVDHLLFSISTVDGIWSLDLRAGGSNDDIVPGTYCFGPTRQRVSPPEVFIDYGPGPICGVSEATFNVNSVEVEYTVDGATSLINFTGNFNLRCGTSTQLNNGSITFQSPATGASRVPPGTTTPVGGDNCDGSGPGGGGGSGGGGGGGFPTPGGGNTGGGGTGTGTLGGFPHPGGGVIPTPTSGTTTPTPVTPPTPTVNVITNRAPEDVGTPLFTTSETLTVPLLVSSSAVDAPVTLSATSNFEGLDFTFSPASISANNSHEATITIKPNASAIPRDYQVDVTARSGDTTSVTSFLITLDCYPPMIVGAPGNQPATQSVQSGKVTTLDVKPSGSGPFTYQWFRGSAGQTNFPISGATNRTFTTPAQAGTEAYWVRVSNACGSVDSTTATLTTTP